MKRPVLSTQLSVLSLVEESFARRFACRTEPKGKGKGFG